MNPILRNILALVAGILVGGLVNAGLITFGAGVIPPPSGVDPNDVESIKANMHLYEFKHFIIPYLAHALGALVGAFVAAKISNNKLIALGVGAFFLVGGLTMMTMIPQPMLFTIVDLISYLPAAFIGFILGRKKPV